MPVETEGLRCTHNHSLLSIRDLEKFNRMQEILNVYGNNPPLTDRQVAAKLGYADLNKVRPRITENLPVPQKTPELDEIEKSQKPLREVGKTIDPVTKKLVRLVTLSWKIQDKTGQQSFF
jgi:hypothetical protein